MVREIFQRKQGKDFYKDQLEYLEYDPDDFIEYDYNTDPDDEEIAYKVAKRIAKSCL